MPLERGRVGTGSVLALDAVGPQDTFLLNDNMADSKWDPTYTQTTNFAITQRSIPLPSSSWIDHEITIELFPKTSGDLISNLHLKCSLPALPPGNVYTDQVGRAIFQQVDFMIDGQVIESLNDDWYILRDQLFMNADEKNAMVKAVNGGYAEGTLSQLAQTPQVDMIIPLDFFFCRRHSRYKKQRERLDQPYFPMCAIYNQRVYIKIKFQKWNWFSNSIAEVRSGLVNLTSPVVLDSLMKTTLTVSPVSNFLPGMYISGLPIFGSRLLINTVDTENNTVTVTSTVSVSPVFYPLTVGFPQVNNNLTIPSSTIFAGTTSTFSLNDTTGIYTGMVMSGVSDYSKNMYFIGKVFVTSTTVNTVTVEYSYQEPRLSNRSGPITTSANVNSNATANTTLTVPFTNPNVLAGTAATTSLISGTMYVTSSDANSITFSINSQSIPFIPAGTVFNVTAFMQVQFIDADQRSFNQNFSGPIPAGNSYTFIPTASFSSRIRNKMTVRGLPGVTGTATVEDAEMIISKVESTLDYRPAELVSSNLIVNGSNINASNFVYSNLVVGTSNLTICSNVNAVINAVIDESNLIVDGSNVAISNVVVSGSNVVVNGSNVTSSKLFISSITDLNFSLSNVVASNVIRVSFPSQTPNTSSWNFPVTVANQTDFIETPELIIEEIQLTEEERQYVRTTQRRIIVNRAVKKPPLFLDQGTSGQITIGIGASFPVTFMAWFIRRTDFETSPRYVDSRYSYGYTTKYINAATPITFFNGVKLNYIDLINNAQITLSGNDILNNIAGGLYFTMKQPFDHSLSVPTKSIYVYAFGLNPKEYNQGGFLDFSPLNAATTTLSLEFNPDYASEISKSFSLYVFYYGYTIIEIKDGFGRLVFV